MLISIASHRQESRKIGEPGPGGPSPHKKAGHSPAFLIYSAFRLDQLIAFMLTVKNSVSPEESSTPSLSVTA